MTVSQKHPEYTRKRIQQLAERLLRKIYPERSVPAELLVSEPVGRILYEEAMRLPMSPASIGMSLDPLWATRWFRVRFTIPQAWAGREVHLLFNSMSEAMIWQDGRPIQGLTARMHEQIRTEWPLTRAAEGGREFSFQIEQASNTLFGERKLEDSPYDHWLRTCEFAVFDPIANALYLDLDFLVQLEAALAPSGSPWSKHLLFELNRFCNVIDEEDPTTWQVAQDILKDLLNHRNGTYAHELAAIGHAHLDTAWLWPLAETHRKLFRTTTNTLGLMEEYPEYKFACSQAYQYAILKRDQPELFGKVLEKAREGQWIPVGGTWIEPDCNLPSGEALCRQFLFGQRFFEEHFGRRCDEFWNPDVFGYNGQLPQIMKQAGISRFLTQKLSWNKFNQPLHHSFWWEALDGTAVLAHFPPVDTYNGTSRVDELLKHEKNYKDSDRSRNAYYLFGHGDGGGGPTRTMLENLRRAADLQGLPRCRIEDPDTFFQKLEAEAQSFCTVTGELYLEVHRGTYTTQGRTKLGNRRSEFWLHDLEFLGVLAEQKSPGAYPSEKLDELWKLLLLNQFHDILPGSSIRQVYEETEADYSRIESESVALRKELITSLLTAPDGSTPLNTLGVARTDVVESPDGLLLAKCPMYGAGNYIESADPVQAREDGDALLLENATLQARIGKDGTILQLLHKPTGRDSLDGPGNCFSLFDDHPNDWDAWDVDPFLHEKVHACPVADNWSWRLRDPLRAEIEFSTTTRAGSQLGWVIRMDAHAQRLEVRCTVDWRESHKTLKAAFPMKVTATEATYEMQFGAVNRPTHMNDMLAVAKFEVPGHRWADLSENGFGVSLLSDCKYGFCARGNTLYLSLLRATSHPDTEADQGLHEFAYALYPHAGDWRQADTVAEGLRFNWPVLTVEGSLDMAPAFTLSEGSLVLDTVKRAEDGQGVVLRLYESAGARGVAHLSMAYPFESASRTNLLEDPGEALVVENQTVRIEYRPWEIVSLRLC